MSLVVEGSQTLLRCALSSADLADSSRKCFLQYVLSLGPFRGMTQVFLLLFFVNTVFRAVTVPRLTWYYQR